VFLLSSFACCHVISPLH
jgi:hypothetical protein